MVDSNMVFEMDTPLLTSNSSDDTNYAVILLVNIREFFVNGKF